MQRGQERQRDIYLGGALGRYPTVPASMPALRQAAHTHMSKEAIAYIDGGAGNEGTITANREAFDRWRIVPRMLRDVSARDTSVSLFGRTLPSPFLLAPIGVLELVHKDSDLPVARAAASEQIPMIFSNQASQPMEVCAYAMRDACRWFQLYWSTSDELVRSFVQRAEVCGCEAIVVTLDTTMLGWRPRDLDLAYLPFLRGMGIAQYTSDPVFLSMANATAEEPEGPKPRPSLAALRLLINQARRFPGSFLKNLTSPLPRAAVRTFVASYSRPSLSWNDLSRLRAYTKLPILLKGLLHADDARAALEAGVDGLVVSNHGGRQVDGALASLEALPAVAEVVDGRIPILLDSGIRGGADIFKALALGATAVLLGRPYVYGLATAGEQGVRDVISNLKADFDVTMGLAGCRSAHEIGAHCVRAT